MLSGKENLVSNSLIKFDFSLYCPRFIFLFIIFMDYKVADMALAAW